MGDTIYIAYNSVTEKWVNLPEGLLGHLDDLVDVNVPSPSDGDCLVYDEDTETWVAAAASAVTSLADLEDVSIPSPDDGDVLTFNSEFGMWEAVPIPPTVTPASTVTSENVLNNTAPAVGTSANYARADHTHGTPPMPTAADVGASPVGHGHTLSDISDAGTMAGVDDAPSDDTLYGRYNGTWSEVAAPGDIPGPGSGVTAETSLSGTAASDGTSEDYARVDHTHGTPSMPNLDDIADVTASTPNDGDILEYDSGTSTWVAVDNLAMTHQQVMARIWIQV